MRKTFGSAFALVLDLSENFGELGALQDSSAGSQPVVADPGMSALLVEDDPKDRLELRDELERMGLLVFEGRSTGEAAESFNSRRYALVLIHLGRSPQDSLALCRTIRAISTVPILMLTQRDELVTEEMALAAGADDYLTKPIRKSSLWSRVRQQLSRSNRQVVAPGSSLVWGPLEMDQNQRLFTVLGQVVELTSGEYEFVRLLMGSPDQIFTRNQILTAVGAFDGENSDHIVDSHASRIRKKVRKVGGPEVITVVRSVGFRLSHRGSEPAV
ncbi:MAG: two-component system response regulator ParR [Pontimonas sp.]|jgi:two-component system response regulator ParR